MVRQWWIIWPLFAAIMGFALGGTIVAALDVKIQQQQATNQTHSGGSKQDQKASEWWDAGTTANILVAAFTGALVLTAVLQVIFLHRSISVAEAAANEARNSNVFAREVFEAERRPWLAWKIEPRLMITSSLGKLHITVTGQFTNIGKAPALRASCFGKLYAPPEDIGAVEPGVAFYAENFRRPMSGMTFQILPGETVPFRFGPYGLSIDETFAGGQDSKVLCVAFHCRYEEFGREIVREIGSVYLLCHLGSGGLTFTREDFNGAETVVSLIELHDVRRIS